MECPYYTKVGLGRGKKVICGDHNLFICKSCYGDGDLYDITLEDLRAFITKIDKTGVFKKKETSFGMEYNKYGGKK